MHRSFLIAALAAAVSVATAQEDASAPRVVFKTNMGSFVVELQPDRAPVTVENFLTYVQDGYYDGTIFHRVVPDFVVQGGGFTPDYQKKETRDPIANEADNGLSNRRGTVSMARTSFPDSATSQFYVNLTDNLALDHVNKSNGRTWGYAVFGKVVEGMQTIDAIAGLETGRAGPFPNSVPKTSVIIESARVEGSEMPASEGDA